VNFRKEKKEMDTVVMAFHIYKVDADKFKELCRQQGRFHAEVLRELVIHYNKYISEGWTFDREKGWIKPKETGLEWLYQPISKEEKKEEKKEKEEKEKKIKIRIVP
jgi:hypothetical protein